VSSIQKSLDTVVPLLVPVVTGVVAAAGLTLKDSRLARDRRNVRDQALADASAEVAFASEWWKTHQLLNADGMAEPTRQAREWLAEAEARLTRTQEISVKHKQRVTVPRLLLMYPMHRRSAKILKACFWLSVALLIIGCIATVGDSTSSSQHGFVGGDVGVWVGSALAALIFRVWAVAADEPARAARAPANAGL
jgi:hypothetical protein